MNEKTAKIPGIDGDCTTAGYEKWLLLERLFIDISGHGQNGNSGKAVLDLLQFSTEKGRASALMRKAVVTGTIYKQEVVIEYSCHNQDGKRWVKQRETLTGLQFLSVKDVSLASGEDGEVVNAKCQKIKFESFSDDNKASGSVTYDFETGQVT